MSVDVRHAPTTLPASSALVPTTRRGLATRLPGRAIGLVAAAGALGFIVLLSLAMGARPMPLATAWDAFTAFDPMSQDHLIVRSLRLPRTAIGLAVGTALGLAGAVMQGLTRNPLADPGILGVNAGASLGVVLAIYWFGISSALGWMGFAMAGALVASVLVYVLGSRGRGGATPVKLALAGAATSAMLFAVVRAILLVDVDTLDQFRFWAPRYTGWIRGSGSRPAIR